ncbi:MAG: hypothetical protein LBE35_09085 [Clostridiales bacterium]|jgi:hypothetical protein|nr:hypothetical protein [Clostridiales bacterium]
MDINGIVANCMPPGTTVVKVYQDGAELKVDIDIPGMGQVTCTVKKNHAGEFYVE